VRRIKFTVCGTRAQRCYCRCGTSVHVVSERLGHATAAMTIEVYAHVLPDAQVEAAALLGGLLHGELVGAVTKSPDRVLLRPLSRLIGWRRCDFGQPIETLLLQLLRLRRCLHGGPALVGFVGCQ
jgi:hypothetical protein